MVQVLALAGAVVLAASGPQAAGGATLVIDFPNLRPVGQVTVAVFANEIAWKGRKQAVRTAQVPLTGPAVQVRFEGLAPGSYGVMAYHDRNANGRLDTLPIGLPTESYGFSRNARGSFGPPAWSAASIAVSEGETRTEQIRLR